MAKEILLSRNGPEVNIFCPRIHFHKKDPLVSHSQNSILSCEITNAELPDFNGMFNITSFYLAYLDQMQSKTVLYKLEYMAIKFTTTTEEKWNKGSSS